MMVNKAGSIKNDMVMNMILVNMGTDAWICNINCIYCRIDGRKNTGIPGKED